MRWVPLLNVKDTHRDRRTGGAIVAENLQMSLSETAGGLNKLINTAAQNTAGGKLAWLTNKSRRVYTCLATACP
jgi:hypothetical protein